MNASLHRARESIVMRVTARYRDGKLELDQPVQLVEGQEMVIEFAPPPNGVTGGLLMQTLLPGWKYLGPKTNSYYKQLYLKDYNIAARTIYGHYMSESMPMTPEEIAADRNVPLEAVLEAI